MNKNANMCSTFVKINICSSDIKNKYGKQVFYQTHFQHALNIHYIYVQHEIKTHGALPGRAKCIKTLTTILA